MNKNIIIMKRIVCTIMAVAALAACTKSEVQYEPAGEIGFAPFTGNITKAEGKAGALASDQELGIYAFWNKTIDLGEQNSVAVSQEGGYAAYNDNYLVNALFAQKSGSWGGSPTGYPWPVNGAIVFAGYTTPGDAVITLDDNNDETTGTEVSYDLANDKMIFSNYENSTEFDLCWFGRTPNAYNNRKNGDAIDVKLNHALSWVSIAVYGEGSPIGWTINSIEWKVPTSGTATCIGTSATWTNLTNPSDAVDILAADHIISDKKTVITNNLVIPSLPPVEITVNYTFTVNNTPKTDSKKVNLKLNEGNTQAWESGVHYTYTLLFKGNEILVAPSYGNWTEKGQTVTVE